jgi:beta-glucosidase
MDMRKKAFGNDFVWGVSNSSFQNEGFSDVEGKSSSIWDTFVENPGKIKNFDHPGNACNFYFQYQDDFNLTSELGFNAFRFSLPWARFIPDLSEKINQKAISHYHKIIDACLASGLTPYITLYHWDLPQYLEDIGGWTNRDVVSYFSDYADIVTRAYGDKVKNWFVLNEPMSFTGLGYYKGYHAPGKKGVMNFLPAVHHAVLAQAEGGRVVRCNVKGVQVGTTFSCSEVTPYRNNRLNRNAAKRVDALLNRLFIEPSLGLGYPYKDLPGLRYIEQYFKPGDEDRMIFNFDMIGLQYYFRVVAKFSLTLPVVFAQEVPAAKRGAEKNVLGMEVYPKGLYKILKQFSRYKEMKKIIITEAGGAFPDKLKKDQSVKDKRRLRYHKNHLKQVLKAKKEGVPVQGYFVWTLVDNFEWSEGYSARFGLIYNDLKNCRKIIKKSGQWFRKFLTS